MKRMLIIGNEHPGIKSIKWEEFSDEDIDKITDYQIVLIDLNDYFPISQKYDFEENIISLLRTGNDVVYLLPKTKFFDNILPFNISTITKTGQTLEFSESDELIQIYKNFISEHKIVINPINKSFNPWGDDISVFPLIYNNIKEVCGFKWHKLYVLHPPDKNLKRAAIKSLVKFYSPDFEEEIIEKPEWAYQFEIDALGIGKIEEEIKKIDKNIASLLKSKEKIIKQKEQITKWSDLIISKGTTLELRLKEAFELLGVQNVQHEPIGSYGPDLVFNHGSLGFTIEVQGSIGPINIEKARQLHHWISDAPNHHQGVLIGNPFLSMPPKDRPPRNNRLFGKEAIEFANKRGFALVYSYFIFELICKKLKGEDVDINEFLQKIYNDNGEIQF